MLLNELVLFCIKLFIYLCCVNYLNKLGISNKLSSFSNFHIYSISHQLLESIVHSASWKWAELAVLYFASSVFGLNEGAPDKRTYYTRLHCIVRVLEICCGSVM